MEFLILPQVSTISSGDCREFICSVYIPPRVCLTHCCYVPPCPYECHPQCHSLACGAKQIDTPYNE
jgi:hypothetical protein